MAERQIYKARTVASVLRTAAIVTLAATTFGAGCSGKKSDRITEVHESVSVPVCEFVAEPGDTVGKLFRARLGGKFYQNVENVHTEQIVMNGEPLSNQNVKFLFSLYDVVDFINDGGRNHNRVRDYSTFRGGERILLPDFNGQSCMNSGEATFDGVYDRSKGTVKKTLTYGGETIRLR